MEVFSSLTSLVGSTPLVKLNYFSPSDQVTIYGKLEGNNPGGSVKDRPAYYMIKNALETRQITSNTKLIEATSGNTGIALAMIASSLNLSIELVMPENSSIERVKTMKAYGAQVVLTPAKLSMEGAINYVREKSKKENFFVLDQFSNPYNKIAHYKTTGPEIWIDSQEKITHFVSAMGTTGTITGTSTFLKEKKPHIQVIGAQPKDGSNIPGIRCWPQEYLPTIYEPKKVDKIINVSKEQAIEYTRALAKYEGIFAGMSSGGALYVATQVAKKLTQGFIVTIICDRGDRYLSTSLFE